MKSAERGWILSMALIWFILLYMRLIDHKIWSEKLGFGVAAVVLGSFCVFVLFAIRRKDHLIKTGQYQGPHQIEMDPGLIYGFWGLVLMIDLYYQQWGEAFGLIATTSVLIFLVRSAKAREYLL